MRSKYFLLIMFGVLACMLVLDGLVLQPLINRGPDLVYAGTRGADPYGHGHHGPQFGPHQPNQPIAVPEPSTLILLGMGATGIGVYLYSKHRRDKK